MYYHGNTVKHSDLRHHSPDKTELMSIARQFTPYRLNDRLLCDKSATLHGVAPIFNCIIPIYLRFRNSTQTEGVKRKFLGEMLR